MREVTGNLWDEIGRADLLLVTTNAMINRHGRLVMGRGAAHQASVRYPDLSRQFAAVLARHPQAHRYGVVLSDTVDRGTLVGAFQVKVHYRHRASLSLIRYSAIVLRDLCCPRYHRIAMNYPGIGWGGLSREQVRPMLEDLPDHVYVYRPLESSLEDEA